MSFMGRRHIHVFGSQHSQRAATEEGARGSQAAESLILVQASLLARMAKFKQSEALLLPLASKPKPSTSALDLLAKICAQQGKFVEAQDLWMRALRREPSNRHFLRALMRCAELQGMDPREVFSRHLFMLICGCAAVCGIAVLVVGVGVFHWWR